MKDQWISIGTRIGPDCPENAPKTASEWCLKHPPRNTPPHPDQLRRHRLHILSQVSCVEGRNSQVVTCRIDDEPQVLLAKIYDPLYFKMTDPYDRDPGVTWLAERFYSCEAAAFERLRECKNLYGKFTPKYHGTWTFQMPLLDGQQRHVRMILMEYIPYPTIRSLIDSQAVKHLDPRRRLGLLVRNMEHVCILDYVGITHGDLSI